MGYLLKLFTGNPVTMIYVALAIFAVGLGLGTTGGWTLNGWRLGTELEHAKGERDRAIDQGKVLAASVTSCNAGVERVEKLAGAALGNMKAMVAEAQRLHAGGKTMAEEIERRLAKKAATRSDGKPKGCDDGWDELEKIRAPR